MQVCTARTLQLPKAPSVEADMAWSGKPKELYYRLMTPTWLGDRQNVTWNCNFDDPPGDLDLKIKPDSRDYERIFFVKLLDSKNLKAGSDLTVKIRAGLEYTGGVPPDPISFTVSDQDHAFGFQLLDMTRYHSTGYGPYYPIEGASGQYSFNPPVIQKDLARPSVMYNRWPRVFEMRLKPTEGFGTCYTALDAGHMISASFRKLDPAHKGLWLEVYRGDDKEHYDINFVEVTVTETNP